MAKGKRMANAAAKLAETAATLGLGDELRAMRERAQRREAADAREAHAVGAVRAPGRKALKKLANYDREKPTLERAAKGAFEVMEARFFDTARDREKLLVDWVSRAGGAGEMYTRGQISWRELLAAARLMQAWELSQTSQLSGTWKVDFTEGGVNDSGARLSGAGASWRAYCEALGHLGRDQRFIVEQRVVRRRPMEEIVRMAGLARYGSGEKDLRRRCDRGVTLLVSALNHLADVYRLPGG